ncbi:thiamine phosphate synthase [Leeuwenhoekiella sp. NPDC079379]|uniref:thiamine phosphate synthase n=1 Tax=Leeuwenhoekiella sp. NPDC079379 TaxID=3364122 RepID=UPI0037C9E330
MNKNSFPYRLYLVLSEEACGGKDFLKVAEEAIKGGVDLIQLREKKATYVEFLDKALRLKEVTTKYDIPLIINDNLSVAQEAKAYGIHVGNNDINPTAIRKDWETCRLLGYSIEYLEQLYNEQTYTSDYLGISPVFKTPTKTDTVTAWGIEGIQQIRNATEKPLVAIGSIKASNTREIIEAGADCVAVVSAICGVNNPQKAASLFRKEIEKASRYKHNLS